MPCAISPDISRRGYGASAMAGVEARDAARRRLPWAIIPAAGLGTRLRPATDTIPKALMPVGLRPMIDWTIDEALDAGVGAIIVIVAPDQPQVTAHVEARIATPEWPREVELHLVEQPRPAGLGDALIRCRPWTGEDSFGVVVPDNWFDAPCSPLGQVAGAHFRTGMSAIGLIEVSAESAVLLGNVGEVELESIDDRDFRITRLGDKAAGTFAIWGSAPMLRGCARYALGPAFYDALEATGPPPAGEWDDVPAFQRLVSGDGLVGHQLQGRHFDVGQKGGYLAAMSYLFERDIMGSGA